MGERACEYFPLGTCARGRKCRFLHAEAVAPKPAVAINKQLPAQPVSKPPPVPLARSFAAAAAGPTTTIPISTITASPISTITTESLRSKPCPYFPLGECKRGKKCRFAHDPAEARSNPAPTTGPVAKPATGNETYTAMDTTPDAFVTSSKKRKRDEIAAASPAAAGTQEGCRRFLAGKCAPGSFSASRCRFSHDGGQTPIAASMLASGATMSAHQGDNDELSAQPKPKRNKPKKKAGSEIDANVTPAVQVPAKAIIVPAIQIPTKALLQGATVLQSAVPQLSPIPSKTSGQLLLAMVARTQNHAKYKDFYGPISNNAGKPGWAMAHRVGSQAGGSGCAPVVGLDCEMVATDESSRALVRVTLVILPFSMEVCCVLILEKTAYIYIYIYTNKRRNVFVCVRMYM